MVVASPYECRSLHSQCQTRILHPPNLDHRLSKSRLKREYRCSSTAHFRARRAVALAGLVAKVARVVASGVGRSRRSLILGGSAACLRPTRHPHKRPGRNRMCCCRAPHQGSMAASLAAQEEAVAVMGARHVARKKHSRCHTHRNRSPSLDRHRGSLQSQTHTY